jgi:hypothetical protein
MLLACMVEQKDIVFLSAELRILEAGMMLLSSVWHSSVSYWYWHVARAMHPREFFVFLPMRYQYQLLRTVPGTVYPSLWIDSSHRGTYTWLVH